MESISKKHLKCRCCGSDKLTMYLDLGLIPLANNLCKTKDDAINAERFPLQVMLCEECNLSQLSEVVDPNVLFSYYTYRSSVNQGYIDHCRKMAIELRDKYKLTSDSNHIDIAGNDGTLLYEFKEILGHKVINIDPAKNLCEIAESKGITSIPRFWSLELSEFFSIYKADLITATNVFAHLDNVTEFLEACKISLKEDGVLVIENPYWPVTMQWNQFDQVYFEHVSYWSILPMIKLCKKVGLYLNNCTYQDIHGGSMRYEIGRKEFLPFNYHSYTNELFFNLNAFKYWGNSIQSIRNEIREGIKSLNGSIVGFAASAKGNTLLNYCGIDHTIIDFICDETPEKIGKYSPGTGIEIKGLNVIIEAQPDYILILSWNFKQEIMDKLKPLCPNSKFILPIPKFEIV